MNEIARYDVQADTLQIESRIKEKLKLILQ
jgi:hypothetical protein